VSSGFGSVACQRSVCPGARLTTLSEGCGLPGTPGTRLSSVEKLQTGPTALSPRESRAMMRQ
jgi:hypothetical protein